MDGLPEKLLIDTAPSSLFAMPAPSRQHTVKQSTFCVGIGLHSGQRICLRISPAPVGHGVVFRRTDLGLDIPARYDLVTDTRLSTVLGAVDGPRVGTVEHLMAALSGSGIDNALLELDGPEVPILDGSADPFLFLLDCAGRVTQDAPRQVLQVLRPVRVSDGEAYAELRPAELSAGLDMAVSIDFAAPAIGRQALSLSLAPATFRQELARARTFIQAAEVAGLQEAGLALGGSFDNAVVVEDARVLNPGGLRMEGEFVRHKMLDVVGDLALAGAPVCARLVAHRPGHRLNNMLLRALFADPTAWRFTSSDDAAGWLSAA